MTPRSTQEQLDLLSLRIRTLETVIGFDRIEAALLAMITPASPPPKPPRRRKVVAR